MRSRLEFELGKVLFLTLVGVELVSTRFGASTVCRVETSSTPTRDLTFPISHSKIGCSKRTIPIPCLGIELTLDDIYGNLPEISPATT